MYGVGQAGPTAVLVEESQLEEAQSSFPTAGSARSEAQSRA